MPLKDLLWACPACHAVEALDRNGVCRSCGTAFTRGRGANIRALGEERGAVQWLERLPWPDVDGEGHTLPAGIEPPFEAAVVVRQALRERPFRRSGQYLGAIEIYGAKRKGRLRLDRARLVFAPDGFDWQLTDLTAIQPASSAIQLKARGQPVISIKFEAGSVRLWEQRLKYCTRAAYREAGRGEIVEFQPWVRVA